MNTDEFLERFRGGDIVSDDLDFHAAFGLTSRVLSIVQEGRLYRVLHTSDSTTTPRHSFEVIECLSLPSLAPVDQ